MEEDKNKIECGRKGKELADVVTQIMVIGQGLEKDLFNWMKLTWLQDIVLRLSCGRSWTW